MKWHIQRFHISKLPEYEKALAKKRVKSSLDENSGAPKQAKINDMISILSSKVTQTGVNDRINELIPDLLTPFHLCSGNEFN